MREKGIGALWLLLGILVLATVIRDAWLAGQELLHPGDLFFGTLFALAAALACFASGAALLKPPLSWSFGRKLLTGAATLLAVLYGSVCALVAAELLQAHFLLASGAVAGLLGLGILSLRLSWQIQSHGRHA